MAGALPAGVAAGVFPAGMAEGGVLPAEALGSDESEDGDPGDGELEAGDPETGEPEAGDPEAGEPAAVGAAAGVAGLQFSGSVFFLCRRRTGGLFAPFWFAGAFVAGVVDGAG